MTSSSFFDLCSDDLVVGILERVGDNDEEIASCFYVCKRWNRLCNDNFSSLVLDCSIPADVLFRKGKQVIVQRIESELNRIVDRKGKLLRRFEVFDSSELMSFEAVPTEKCVLRLLGRLSAQRIQFLRLENILDVRHLFQFLLKCSKLKTLMLDELNMKQLEIPISTRIWPCLRNLKLSITKLNDRQLERIVDVCPNLEELFIDNYDQSLQFPNIISKSLVSFDGHHISSPKLEAVKLGRLIFHGGVHLQLSGTKHLDYCKFVGETLKVAELLTISYLEIDIADCSMIENIVGIKKLVANDVFLGRISRLLHLCEELKWGPKYQRPILYYLPEDNFVELQYLDLTFIVLYIKGFQGYDREQETRTMLRWLAGFEQKCPSLVKVQLHFFSLMKEFEEAKEDALFANSLKHATLEVISPWGTIVYPSVGAS